MVTKCKNGGGYLNNTHKGFTLIELLAVIVILAIIALIATPITLNIIENSKRSSVKVGTLHYVDTIEKELQYDALKDENIESGKYVINEDGTYSVKGKTKKINAKGHLPTNGIMCVNERGLVESYSLVLDGYVVTDSIGKQEIEKGTILKSLTCDVKEELVEIEIPENSNICSKNKIVKIKYPEYEGMIKEYSLNRKEWIEYKKEITVTTNGTIYARLRSKKTNETSSLASLTITTVDNDKVLNEKPSLILSKEKPTSEIQATFKQTDNCGLDNSTIEYGISETKEGNYKYQKESVFKNLKNNTTYYIKTRANDIAGNGIEESEISEITTGEFSGIEITPNSTSWTTSKTVTIKGSTTGAKLQYKVVSGTTVKTDWTEYSSALTINWTATTSNPTYVYARLYDGTNYSSETTLTITTVDTTSPTVPNVTYNSGSNTCSWKNNYNISLSSSDNESGISYYEIDFYNDGIVNGTTGSNFIPANGYSSCNTRFRAVDKVGNRSEWTSLHHIHMDTEAPGKTIVNLNGYTSGTWTSGNVTQTASATDNVGISYYQYSHDGVNVATTFPNPWTITWNGQWNFYVRAIDYAGNVGEWSNVYTIRRGVYSASSVCGIASYNTCQNSACGVASYNRCASAGVESYNSCATSGCGVASYNTCQSSACGTETYTYNCTGTCYKYSGGGTTCSGTMVSTSYCENSYSTCCRTSYSCTKTCTGTRNKTCATSACGVASYNTCQNSACGVNLYNRGAVCGVESYNSCATSACGVASYNTCWHT